MSKTAKKEVVTHLLEGRVFNASLFEKDKFDEKATASYKIEFGWPKGDPQTDDILNKIMDFADDTWGKSKVEYVLDIDNPGDFNLISGLRDGDKLARKREQKGKEGDGYKGMWIIRASTIYNKDGVDGPGGVSVYDEDTSPITVVNQSEFWLGCKVMVGLTMKDYVDDDSGANAVTFYLAAVQKIGGDPEKDRLVKAADRSTLFKPVGRTAATGGDASGGRRRRAG